MNLKPTELPKFTEFGNPILEQEMPRVPLDGISSERVQKIIQEMKELLATGEMGIAIAANQADYKAQIVVINIKKTPARPDLVDFEQVMINPTILDQSVEREPMWEGCLSLNEGGVFAQAERHTWIKVNYVDEHGQEFTETYDGLRAHVVQHEVDHLNGIKFTERVKDGSSFMTVREYRKRIVGIDE